MASLNAKFFLGNSFFISAGLGQRKAEANFKAINMLDTSEYLVGNITASSIVGNVGIGNTWAWNSGFFLGCEWLGAAVPLSSSSSGSLNYSHAEGESLESFRTLKADMEDTADKIGKMTTLSAFIFHLGISF